MRREKKPQGQSRHFFFTPLFFFLPCYHRKKKGGGEDSEKVRGGHIFLTYRSLIRLEEVAMLFVTNCTAPSHRWLFWKISGDWFLCDLLVRRLVQLLFTTSPASPWSIHPVHFFPVHFFPSFLPVISSRHFFPMSLSSHPYPCPYPAAFALRQECDLPTFA